MSERDRYEGMQAWYESVASTWVLKSHPDLVRLLGRGAGLCLDLGCGTGLNFVAFAGTGRWPMGLDLAAAQLAVARTRSRSVVRADARCLPFANAVFDAVTAVWVSTDIDNFDVVLREAARVLHPRGTFL